MLGVFPLIVLRIYPIVQKRININKVKVEPKYYTFTGILPINPKEESHYKKPLHMKHLIFTGVGLWIGFLVICYNIYTVW